MDKRQVPDSYAPPPSIFSGEGNKKPESRQLSGGMFGHLPDAYEKKTIELKGETPYERRERQRQEGSGQTSPTDSVTTATTAELIDEVDAEPVVEVEPDAPMLVFEAVSRGYVFYAWLGSYSDAC